MATTKKATIKRADWVKQQDGWGGYVGFVKRVARDGSWADVKWRGAAGEWTKRMPTYSIEPLHTITTGEWQIEDVTRRAEIEAEDGAA